MRPPPEPIDWEPQPEQPQSLWRAAWNIVRFVFTGKGTP